MSHLPPLEFLRLALFLTQELTLDAATPGKPAKERVIQNAKLLRDACLALAEYWQVNPQTELASIYAAIPNRLTQEKP